jgi:predicted enzyme related to lactoylglutathione lyase
VAGPQQAVRHVLACHRVLAGDVATTSGRDSPAIKGKVMTRIPTHLPAKEPEMELVQSRIVTGDVRRLAAFYARLVGVSVVLNDYYVEVPAGAVSVGFSRRRFTEYQEEQAARPGSPHRRADIILDFQAGDVDAEYQRIAGLGVHWVMPPATQPWGNRSMIFRDPEGHLVNVFSPGQTAPG